MERAAPTLSADLAVRHPDGSIVLRTDADGRVIVPRMGNVHALQGDARQGLDQAKGLNERLRGGDEAKTPVIKDRKHALLEGSRRALQHLEDLGGG